MTNKKYKAGIIGCGQIGALMDNDPKRDGINTHAKAYSSHSYFELIAGTDPSEENLARFAETYKAQTYNSITEMLGQNDFDIVSICTPPSSHKDIIEKLIAAKVKTIWCEKPFASNSKEANQLVQLCKQNSTKIVVNYFRRFDPTHLKIASLIQSNELGKIQSVRCTYSKGLRNNGSHQINLVQQFLGPIQSVQATGHTVSDFENDPSLDAVMLTKSNIPVFLQACSDKAFRIFETDVIGETGRILVQWGGAISRWDVKPSPRTNLFNELSPVTYEPNKTPARDLSTVLNNILEHWETGKEIYCTGENAIETNTVVDSIIESNQNEQKRISISL